MPLDEISRVALTFGESRADNVSRALRLIEAPIKAGLARKKRVLLKPNMVVTHNQLAASHADCLEAILDFVRTWVKDEILIADSPAAGSPRVGFENYDYYRLARKYRVKFLDLDEQPIVRRTVVDQRYHARPVRLAKLLLDEDVYIISSAIMKTHDRALVTLSLKNIVVGAAIKDPDFHWGPGSKGVSDKMIIHGGPRNEGIHYNLSEMARYLHPHLSVIDGFQGMEGNGPASGTPVDHKIALASTDWLAADRIATDLMGFDFQQVGYLWFSAQAGLGQADPAKIELLGEKVADHARKYRPHDSIDQQLEWLRRS